MTNRTFRRVTSSLSLVVVALTVLISAGLAAPATSEAQVSSLPIDFSDVAIFATNSVRIDNGAQVTSGHVVVNNASPGPTLSPGVELGLGNNAHTPTGYAIVADSISISNGAVVGGNAFFNTLSNSGTINGTQNTPLALPVFSPLPTFKSAPPGTLDVTVPNGTVQTLAAGNYRDITVQQNATLRIDQGVTNVRSIAVSNGGKLLFLNLTSGPSEVRVAEQMTIGNNFVVGPVDSDPLKAGKIVFYVASASLMPVAVDTGNGGTLYANVYAPNGTLILDNGTNAVGAFLAQNVDVQNGSHVGLESFFTQQPPVITSANSTTFTVLQSNSFTVTATGVPTPTITQSGTLPSGVNFMDNGNGTATLSGIPASGTVGTYPITFMANNAAGSTSQPFTLTVIKASQTITFTSTAPAGATVGGPTYNVTATATSGLAVSFTIDGSASSVCSIAGSTVSFIGAGTCVINANQPGNADYNAAPQVQQSFAVGKGNQTITFTSTPPANAVYQGPTYTVTATATSGLTVTFSIDPSASTVCSIAGSTVSFIGAGTCVINANQAGDANYNPAPQVQQSFAVAKASQTITFTSSPPATPTVGGATYTVTATATSGLTVAFTIDGSASTVCSIAGSTVSFIGNGTCVINANQAGNANYDPAPQVQQSFTVKSSQTITFTSSPPAQPTVGGPTYLVTATATSGLTVTFTIDPSASTVCSISGSTVSFIGAGTCVINANQAGNANFYPAPQVQQSFGVKNAQTITFTSTAPSAAVYQGPTYTVTATASSGLTVTFTIDASATSVCSIAGSVVSFIGTGTCVIDANQPGNANFYPAPQVQQSFSVGPKLVADSYNVVGNTQLVAAGHSAPTTPFTADPNSLLANDASDVAIVVTAVTGAATTGGGSITIDAAGTFTYTPPLGQSSGTDTYVYTGTANGVSRTATVTFNIANIVWYVDNASTGSHDGASSTPFLGMGPGPNNLGSALSNTGPAAGAYIYVSKGVGTTTGAYTFKPSQTLIGAGATLTVGALSVAGNAANTPTLGGTLTLANNVTTAGFDMSTGAASALVGTATGLNVSARHVVTTTATAVNLTNAAGAVSLTSVTTSGALSSVDLASFNGTFAVTGDGTGHANGSGGSISNALSHAINLTTGAGTVSLSSMDIGLNTAALYGVLVDNNAGGALIANVTGVTFTGVTASVSQNKALLQFEAADSANVTANVQNSYFNGSRTYGMFATAAGTSVVNVTLNQSGFGTDVNTGAPVDTPGTAITNPPAIGMALTNSGGAQLDYVVSNNTFWGASGSLGALSAVGASGAATTGSSHLNGSWTGNRIGKAGVTGSGCASGCGAMLLLPGTQGAFKATITGNDIRQVNSTAITFSNTVGGGATFSGVARIKDNTLTEPDTTGSPIQRAILISPGNSGGASTSMCAEIGNNTGAIPADQNTISGSWQAGNFIRITNNNNTVAMTLPGLSPATGATAAQVNTFVTGSNNMPASSVNTTLGAAGINGSGSPCP